MSGAATAWRYTTFGDSDGYRRISLRKASTDRDEIRGSHLFVHVCIQEIIEMVLSRHKQKQADYGEYYCRTPRVRVGRSGIGRAFSEFVDTVADRPANYSAYKR